MQDIVVFENYNILHEMSAVSGEAWKNLSNAKPIDRNELMEMIEPGDVVITRNNPAKVPGMGNIERVYAKMFGNLLSKAMGVPFTSCKVCISKQLVAGFGANGKSSTLDVVQWKDFLNYQMNVLVCKYPGITDAQRKKIVQYVLSKKGIDFDNNKLLSTWWDRLVHGEKLLQNRELNQELTTEKAKAWKEALFCSSLAAMAYKSAGINADFTRNPLEVWPKDFVASKDMEQVAILYQ